MVTLIAMLTILIIVVAGLGVLNTVALQIRERAHDIGVFKAMGMTPRQTLTMIVWSVTLVGWVAGIVAVPVGVHLHRGVLPTMAHAANSGVPPSLLTVFAPWEIALLALSGHRGSRRPRAGRLGSRQHRIRPSRRVGPSAKERWPSGAGRR